MKTSLKLFLLLAVLLAACAPAAKPTNLSTPMPLPSPTPLASEQAIVSNEKLPDKPRQVEPTKISTGDNSPIEPTNKPKGGNAPIAPTSSNPEFIAYEITGRPSDSSVTVNVVPAVPMTISYEYGTTSGVYTAQTASQTATANTPLETLLSGLQPDTRYYYRINYNGATGEERTFVTQRAAGSTFTFGIQGDSHPERTKNQFDPNLYTKTLLSAAADQLDFYMTIGDDFSVDTLKDVNPETVRAQYVNQRQWLGLVGAPVFLVNGNHEQASLANLDGSAENVAVWAQNARNTYYPQPGPDEFYTGNPEPVEHIGLLRDYYAWEWGDALFVVIDPYWHSPQSVDNQFGADRDQKKNRDLWNVTLGETQYRWFRHTLETSTAKYKFVFTHHVLGTGRGGIELANGYEWGDSANLAKYRPGWDKTIHQVMVDSGVTIFFQGHDHIFARQELDGVIYQTLPEPANPFYSWENEDAYKSGDKFPNSGYLRVSVSPEHVTVDYIRTYLDRPDEAAFSYTLPSTPMSARQPTYSSAPTQIPLRGAKVSGSGQGQSQGSDASQDITFEIPEHALDVILGRPTDTSITLSLLSSTHQAVSITYGAQHVTSQTISTALFANTPEEIVLTDLLPDTEYIYSINGDENTFHTARALGSTFTFTIQSDSHLDSNSNPQVYQQTIANQSSANPDFMIDLGDTFMTDKYRPYTDALPQYLAQRYFLGQLGVPIYLILGNHDGEGAPKGQNGAQMSVWSAQLRTKFFPNPAPDGFYSGNITSQPEVGFLQDYYAFTWGDALFIVLDPYWFTPATSGNDLWNPTLGVEQYHWLKTTLETSHAKWKFVFIHQLLSGTDKNGRGGVEVAPFYEWGGKNSDGTWGFSEHRPGWEMPIHQLLVANQVTAVFHGHDHLFAKQELDGIIYQEVPQPATAHANNDSYAAQYGYVNGNILGSPGHIRVTITPEQALVEYVRTYLPEDSTTGRKNGQVDFSFAIPAK